MQANQQSVTAVSSELFGNPFLWYAKMRRESPVFYDAEQQSWMIFRYEDVKQVFANWQTFSSNIPHPPEQTDFTQSLNYTDPPKHRSLRSLVAKVFTARRVEELAPRITQITHELIDQVQKRDRMDFMHDLAIPLPVIVIAEILGVPVEDRADFKHWSDGIVLFDSEALQAMANYFRHLLEQRRQHPSKDLISDLIAAQEAGETLTAQELVDFCIVLLVGGNETTTNLLGNAILCFNEYPDAWERLKREPKLLPLAIEEVLRYRSSIQAMERFTKVETQLSGQTIPAGQRVTVWMGAANRDEAQFDRAENFVVDRDPNAHLAFGNGIHFCLGAPLARLEATIVLSAVLERLPNLRIDPNATLEFIPSTDVHGVKSLPVLL
ncbi:MULTISPECIES: cytochrome P450 [unclassified Microcoleus]|uniref:cytochrome P450 n=1 Tax=unclassified Microcoleus TaxID=2642155 RepID=UPI001D9E1B82|nr:MULTISPECIES: cytochrome P450 [unclassified Microcoleus]MCC3506332.1 cytochrome P450 [Microcoleus sp. PH2017_19_SFW_U_A]TAE07454.1 MAG: cytochrome P450 [Oscillatoriales cyanobacterium]MCC3414997.1 cytochrome P450 [Microcoleus sp. PH2017_02_FOX_O_A]MCC3494158.1 cytochrome P450 [Microcoleus sp. PH2017_16_JOR_D_A]MCC3519132.1 cytochrome P450 [Microcoleus sp. PH2017_18_LLB_O_A]